MLKLSGLFLLKLVYGKKFEENCREKMGLTGLLSIANIFWLLSILFLALDMAAKDADLCKFMAVVYPVVIVIWSVIERKRP